MADRRTEALMPMEIERKFLVVGDGWRDGVSQVDALKDGLIARFPRGKVRVRLARNRGWIAVKGERKGACRQEYEYEIPAADAEALLQLCDEPVIEKMRHCVPFGGRLWSVDVHLGALEGLVLAEVELDAEGAPLALPPWIGEEVTHDTRYKKRNLVKGRVSSPVASSPGHPSPYPAGLPRL